MFEPIQHNINKNGLYPSFHAQLGVFNLLNPIVRLFYTSQVSTGLNKVFNLIPPEYTLPCDLRVINMRTLHETANEDVTNTIGFILQRLSYDCSFDMNSSCTLANNLKTFGNLFPKHSLNIKHLTQNYLTLTKEKRSFNDFNVNFLSYIGPNEIEAFKLTF